MKNKCRSTKTIQNNVFMSKQILLKISLILQEMKIDPTSDILYALCMKAFMTDSAGNSEFCFPSTSMFSLASPWRTFRVSGNKTHCFPLGQPLSAYCTPHSNLHILRTYKVDIYLQYSAKTLGTPGSDNWNTRSGLETNGSQLATD